MDSKKYWEDRAKQRLISSEKKALRLEKDLKKQFQSTYKNIEKEISKFYFKYANESGLSYDEAIKYLNTAEFKAYKNNVSDYIKYAQDNNLSENYINKLKALSTNARVNRLQSLKQSIEFETHKLYDEHLSSNLQITIDDILNENYYKTIFDVQQFSGYGVAFNKISQNTLTSLLEFPWSGKNYSDKIWGNVNNFSSKLEDILTQGIIQGKSNQDMAKKLQKATDVAYSKAVRLVRTETNFIANQATNKAYKECNVDKYQFLATLDLRTSEICAELDEKEFDADKAVVGVNYPPMHPHCRSTTIPYFEDLDSDGGTRIARAGDGTQYKVPGNMTYNEWYDKYVKSNSKELIAQKKIKNKSTDMKQYTSYKEALGKDAPKSFDLYQDLKYNDSDSWKNLQLQYKDQQQKKRLRSDKQIKTIEIGKQGKHILEHNNYIEGRSYITISIDEANKLVGKYAGTGEILRTIDGKFNHKELILSNSEIIGMTINPDFKEPIETSKFIIHYSKKGTHIVPTMKGGKNE